MGFWSSLLEGVGNVGTSIGQTKLLLRETVMGGVSEKVHLKMIDEEVMALHPYAQSHYFRCIANGVAPRLAIGLATNMSPSMKGSDRTLNQTQRRNMENMESWNREKIIRIAEKAGISTHGKFYVGGLGRHNDPAAWVSTYDDAIATCKKKNLTANTIVYHKGVEEPPPPRKRMAEDIVQEYVTKEVRSDPKLQETIKKNPKKLKEVREKVIETHSKPKT